MDGVDPDILLEWLQTGIGEERDIQLMALEQLCMLLLMSDNIDQCFESCPPRTFLPALCKIFLDETATENVLEVTARAITYYLDVSNECTKRITQVDGAVKAICNRLKVAEMSNRTSKDLAEQCVKLLEHICQREASAVYDAGGLQCMLTLVRQHGQYVHKDTIHSAMSVITRLCCKIEPNDSALPECSANLGVLLEHDDSKVSECALRCFATLTDRFIRKSMDPIEMARHGNLVEHLLKSLVPSHIAAKLSTTSFCQIKNIAQSGSVVLSDSVMSPTSFSLNRPTSFTSVVILLLSNLCRGSPTVTEQVVSCPIFLYALKAVWSSKDERCIMDALRLCDLLVVLLCEGRHALPKNMISSITSRNETGSNFFDRSHRHLIDAIRQRDTDALIDAVDSGQVDANFTDDVGQTLLNWSSAFGTPEMVTYLCDKGADVNRGQRSSSLHYAACFGRSDIVKILLKHGANPDLRDEEGKTPLDKARERNENEHQIVASILENPDPFIFNKDNGKKMEEKVEISKEVCSEKIDHKTVRQLLEQLLPVLCDVFERSLDANVRKSSLSLLRKVVHHISPESLQSLIKCGSGSHASMTLKFSHGQQLTESLVNVLITAMEHEDDDTESHENVLQIIKSLLNKNAEYWLDQLVRVGVFEKIESITNHSAPSAKVVTVMIIDEKGRISKSSSLTVTDGVLKKLLEISPDKSFDSTSEQNREKHLPASSSDGNVLLSAIKSTIKIHDRNELDTSNEFAAGSSCITQLALPAIANAVDPASSISVALALNDQWEIVENNMYRWKGWRLVKSWDSFFIWSDAVAVEFSDGSSGRFRYMLDGQLNTISGDPEAGSHDSTEARCEFLDKLTKTYNTVVPGSVVYSIFSAPNSNKMIEIGNWVLTSLKAGELIITSRNGNQQRLIIVEDLPGLDFVTSSAVRDGVRCLCFRTETQRTKLQEMAVEIWNKYLREAHSKPRDALVELKKASLIVKEICGRNDDLVPEHILLELEKALKCMHASVVKDRLLSTFELSISGIVDALLAFLKIIEKCSNQNLLIIFRKVFADQSSLSALIGKIVSILDTVEKFPQYLYDTPGGSSFGLQLVNRRIKLRMEQLNPNTPSQIQLLDRSGRTMKAEPLTTVKQLKSYISRMVSKQWYDQARETFHFIKKISEAKRNGSKISFTYTSDFDDKGIIYWLGTNGNAVTEWINPASVNIVIVTSSDGERLPYGRHEDILSRDSNALNCHTSDDKNAYFTIDFGIYFYPNNYTLRHARGYGRSALRNWLLQGSRNGLTWDVLFIHENDTALNYPGSTATWTLLCTTGPYRYIRIAQNGKNASNHNHFLSLSGFEIYGDVVDAVNMQGMLLEARTLPFQKKQFVDNFGILNESTKTSNNDPKAAKRVKKCLIPHKELISTDISPVAASPAVNNFGVNLSTALNDASNLRTPAIQTNNKFSNVAVGADTMHSSSNAMKNRIFRYRRSSRLLAASMGRGVRVINTSDTVACPIGSRVVRGPDWKWDNQGNNTEGTVMSVVDNGWVDVQWDDRTSNSYRFGADGKYDIELKPGEWTSSTRRGFRGFIGRREGGLTGTNFQGRQLPPVPPAYRDPSPLRISDKSKHANVALSQYCQNVTPYSDAEMSGANQDISRLFLQNDSQKRHNKMVMNDVSCIGSQQSETSIDGYENISDPKVIAVSQPSSAISQKSMSTTNLFDGTETEKRTSVASTNQAASAESLQHQTPSLENLLARSKVFDDRILEVVSDEVRAENQCVAVDTDQESVSTNNVGLNLSFDSFDGAVAVIEQTPSANISVAASTCAGGSQPALFGRYRESFEKTRCDEQRDTSSYPRESVGSFVQNDSAPKNTSNATPSSVASTRNLTNLSVSAPNLVLLRHLQQSAVNLNTDQVSASGENDLVRTVLQDLANDPSRFRSLRRLALTGNGTTLITDDIDNALRESVRPRIPAQGHERILNESSRPSVSDVPSDVKIIYEDNDGIVVCRPSHVEPNKEHRESVTDETKAGSSIAKCAKTGDKTNLYSCSDEHPSDENIQNKIEVAADLVRSNQSGPSQKSEIVSGSRRNIQEGCLRSRLGSYADILRTVVMQQIIDSGGSVNSVELEDVEDDMYGDEIAFDGNEDDCDEEYVNGFSVEALAQAAVALHRQSSGGSTESNRDLKLSWKQVVRGEAGRLIDDRGFHISNSTADQGNGKCNRNWDDEFVLRHQLSALIPAFDPRPGRTNVNQIQEVELPQSRESLIEMAGPSCSPVQLVKAEEPKLRLYLRGPNLTSINNITIELDRDDKSIFYYLQQLVQSIEWGQKNDRTRRIWEPTYTLIYGDMSDSNELPITMNKSVEENNRIPENIVRTLSVISRLYQIAANISEYEISSDIFVSEKLTLKLLQELSDPLIVSSRALPSWCDELIFNHPCLFAVETRINYFRATAFGASRSIVWLQTRRDQMLERSRGSAATVPLSSLASTRRDDHYPEFRLGRIKHERIKVPRSDEHLFEYAVRLMQFHASRKAILEIEYINEEGTGLGPTLEFYALIAAEFQRKNLAMWICDDIDTDETMEIDLGKGIKPPGYYVRRSGGLFPAPLPVSSAENSRVSELFRILGIFLAKVLQDGRLVDLPLSQPFLKLMTSSQIAEEEMDLNGVLDLSDLENISPNQGYILKKLAEYVERRKSLSNYDGQNIHIPHQKDKQSMLCISGVECSIEDLSLTFCINPSSTVFNYKEMELIENGANIDVNADNVEQYIAAYTDFYLNSGIVNQIKAFREGFDLVFPLRNLRMFTPKELQSLLCGEQCPQWTREDIINFTEPKLGYTKDSPGFLRFVDVLVGMNASERKSFLQFTTGCSSLPPGGLANLHPRLTVVRKVDSGDGSYPSVNTCVHYLKLPDYTSTEIMRERLITATNEKGFHLN